MSAHGIHDCKAIAREMFVQAVPASADVAARPVRGDMICSIKTRRDDRLESTTDDGFYPPTETSFLPLTRLDAANLVQLLRQLEAIAKRQAPRIAFKARGRILFLDLAEIVAVQAEGNYVSLQYRRHLHLLRQPLSCIAEKLKPYGFIRIHRSVLVNTSLVEEIESLSTGNYRLRVKGGKEYMVTRRYKNNLRHLAHLWIGTELFCS